MLDIPAASDAIRRLRCAGREREVIVEFGAGAQCNVVALSLVAEAIASRVAPVSVRGLCGHDVRILEYLGVSLTRKPVSEPLE